MELNKWSLILVVEYRDRQSLSKSFQWLAIKIDDMFASCHQVVNAGRSKIDCNSIFEAINDGRGRGRDRALPDVEV